MGDLTPLIIPPQNQIIIDPVPKECPSEGFNYPVFRQLNKQARVYLSSSLNSNLSISHRLLAVANSRGWFVAIRSQPSGSGLVLSPLESLRSSLTDAKPEGTEADFQPERLISIPIKANIVTFSSDETKLFVGLEDGSVVVYDTSSLLISGTNDVQPSKRFQLQQTPLRQIVPNPGTEPSLKELVAIVGEKAVQLLNLELEPQGGWLINGGTPPPSAVDWSPKGKHIAIGLQTGDILTYALTNKTSPHKHIPSTCNSALVSLQWVGPAHTFRTSYSAPPEGSPAQHIVILDTKASKASYFSPDHPFPAFGRDTQASYVLNLPRWDVEEDSNEHKSLLVVADLSSVDVEVLGSIGNQWYRHTQDNPLTLPLDKNMDDTMIFSLEADLSDRSGGVPVIYAYLNDGSIQGWYLEHSKPYLPMMAPEAAASTNKQMTVENSDPKPDTNMTDSAFGQKSPAPVSPFGQTGFGTSTSPPFGGAQQTSAFGQSGFGQASTTTVSAFGQPSFGQTSTFGGGGTFGQNNQSTPSTSPFQSSSIVKPAQGFGAFGAFGASNNNNTPSSGAFSSIQSNSAFNAFGSTSFGATSSSNTNNTDSEKAASSQEMTREASMSDSTTGGFGGLSLGGSHPTGNAVNSMFGSFGATQSTSTNKDNTPAFGSGSIVKPAAGFGAFGSTGFGGAFASNKPTPTTTTTFALSQPVQSIVTTSSGFGQSGFGSSGFGKPAFGQSAFGQSGFGPPPATTSVSTSGGFGSFANKSVSLVGGEKPTELTSTPVSGGFGAFTDKPASFGNVGKTEPSSTSMVSGGFGAFGNQPSGFGTATNASEAKPTAGGFAAFANKPAGFGGNDKPLAFGATTASSSPSSNDTDPKASPSNVFSSTGFGSSTSSLVKPAAGFGAFGASSTPSDSPFFKKPTETSISTFSALSATPTKESTASASANLAFGSPSVLGSQKSAFAPVTPTTPETPPATGAFSSSKGGFAAFAGSRNSFSDLLKKGDDTLQKKDEDSDEEGEIKEENSRASGFGNPSGASKLASVFTPPPSKSESPTTDKPRSSIFGTPASTTIFTKQESPSPDKSRASVFGTPTTPKPSSAFESILVKKDEDEKGKEKEKSDTASDEKTALNTSSGTISDNNSNSISASSSFVEVEAEKEEEEQGDEDGQHSDIGSFLSEDEDGSYKDGDSINDDSDQDDLPDIPEEPEELNSPEQLSRRVSVSRSPSATPQPELPSIEVSESLKDDEDKASKSTTREASTTPPSTPVKDTKAPVVATPPASGSVSPFGIGLGRPSTKPTRSSPLANAVVPGDSDEEKEKGKVKSDSLETPSQQPLPVVSPKPIFGKLPVEDHGKGREKRTDSEGEEEPVSEETDKPTATTKRPKTPPLLSQMGPPPSKSPLLSVIPTPDSETSSSSKTTSSAPSLFGLGANPAAAGSAPSVFGAAAPSLFGKPELKRASTAPASPAATPESPSVLGIPAFNIANIATTKIPAGPSTLFGTSAKTPAFPASNIQAPPQVEGASGLFGKPSAPSNITNVPLPSTGGLFGSAKPFGQFTVAPSPTSLFGTPGARQTPTHSPNLAFGSGPSLFGKSAIPSQPSTFVTPSPPPAPVVPPRNPLADLEEGMQKECIKLVLSLQNEFMEHAKIGQKHRQMLDEPYKSGGGSRYKKDLGEKSKWSLKDLQLFSQVLMQYEADLVELEKDGERQKMLLRDLKTGLLKAGMRKEEIVRFQKAKDDKEFAKVLKMRTLGPEYSESQSNLRKSIRAIRDRVVKLESCLQENKKKLSSASTMKPAFKAPSLDTINRTYRNIELTIDRQSDEVAHLASRISKLKVLDTHGSLSSSRASHSPSIRRGGRDPRLLDSTRSDRRPAEYTPNIAETTAAALNAERSAHRLKKALLSVRKEPLLNKKASVVPLIPVPAAFGTPQKAPAGSGEGTSGFKIPFSSPLFSAVAAGSTMYESELAPLNFDLPPDDEFDPTGSSSASHPNSGSGRRGGGQRKHPSVPLKRSNGPGTGATTTTITTNDGSSAPAGFNWGPLPSTQPKGAKLPASFVSFSTAGKR